MTAGHVTEHLCDSEASQRLSVACKLTRKYLHACVVIHMAARTEAQARETTDGEIKQRDHI